ncbi:hypothetical protein PHISCL_06046 [Aspergillus sclerotialis]|uniref:Uncharacterized protein n=1 Tax=Aspergillus sclerotialis TaxID=2070753 RepID=A0A3A2ZX41_9EURO|nr:hypothetical protein PHISCL_06046 [Aspergillus sclerotialis]
MAKKYSPSEDRNSLISELDEELILLQECPHEAQAIVKRVKGIVYQLRQLELRSEGHRDQQKEHDNLGSPSLWDSDSGQLKSPVSLPSPTIEGAESSEGESAKWDEVSDGGSDGELLNSHLKERISMGSRGKKKNSGSRKEQRSRSRVR